MIELIGLFTAVFAGLLALGSMPTSGQDGSDVPSDDTSGQSEEDQGTFTLGDGAGQSNDAPPTIDPNLELTGSDQADILSGNAGRDLIWGAAGSDLLTGRSGDDSIMAGLGRDEVYGGAGNDLIFAGEGNDTIFGEAGNDVILGEGENDKIYAGPGDDLVSGDAGSDQIFGGEGRDTVLGGQGNDSIDGGLDNDLIFGGDGADEVFGGAGDDTIWGQAMGAFDMELDFLNGGDGNDVLMLGQADIANGGAGHDIFEITDYGGLAADIVDFDPSQDHLVIQYDAAQIPNPMISVQTGPDGSTYVLLNDVTLVTLSNGVTIDANDVILRAI